MNEAPVTRSTLNVTSQQKSKAKNNIRNTFHSNEFSSIEQRQKYKKHFKKDKNTAEDITGEEDVSSQWYLEENISSKVKRKKSQIDEKHQEEEDCCVTLSIRVKLESIMDVTQFQAACQQREGNCSPPWRLLSTVLGAICLLLMSVAMVMTIFTTHLSSERSSSTFQQEGLHHPCPENWVWFRCSCYYFSKEELTCRESQRACLSLNSSLIRMNKKEMNFFSLKTFFWVGVYYNETRRQWLWEDHSVPPSGMFSYLEANMKNVCASYRSKEAYLAETCTAKLTYICKK
ncbi:killer cell lectin-like receptor subfamily E member 1 isoform X2 [Grammomys surdaster]|uniref:killer cell lectin-like receptor subfamily E member 1 isoform X2 n=1 Tax=Grammomys surdaster TaxID=491861 RepID=UPI00109EFCF8|nr:killer cell lectin-like receptor subfamily E member 1 isoform X2 [Grammomys surdaster]